MAIEFTDKNFEEEVLKSDKPVLVDFWAPWCGPCQMMGSIIEELAQETSSWAKVGKLNVDENPNTSANFGVMSIPTIIVFKDGKAIEQTVGVQAKESLVSLLKKVSEKK